MVSHNGNEARGVEPKIAAFAPSRDAMMKAPETNTRADLDALKGNADRRKNLAERATQDWVSDVRASGKFAERNSIGQTIER